MKGVLKSAMFLIFLTLIFPDRVHAQSKPNTLTQQEISEGWILLFDGETNFGWENHGNAEWKIADGIVSVISGDNGWLGTTSLFSDFVLKADYRTGIDGNSGIFLRSASEGEPAKTGYELQICDTHKEYVTGSLVNYHNAQKKVSFTPDQWHSYEVRAEGDRFLIKLNGKTLLNVRDKTHAVGHIGLQYNKGKGVEFRNIKLKPLGLKSIFNGKRFSEWQKVNNPERKTVPEWSIRNKAIHVEGGPGQIETEAAYGDFVFQLEIRTNPKDANHHPNSGIFFRGDRNT
ncbi:MAG TPA: family 16 glycoside hydrolase, partial [Candidatus Hodarchaeales archaeon]|nr:family 16 glycoside hydrolase [Candidatus Hodarchaeales archaeon]